MVNIKRNICDDLDRCCRFEAKLSQFFFFSFFFDALIVLYNLLGCLHLEIDKPIALPHCTCACARGKSHPEVVLNKRITRQTVVKFGIPKIPHKQDGEL